MADTKESMPAQPKTQELPAMTDRALLEDLSRVVRDGFAEMRGNITLLVEEGKTTNARMGILEHRVTTLEDARRTDSTPAKVGRVSENDAKQDAAIAQIIIDVAGVKAEVAAVKAAVLDIKKAVTGFFENKKVKMVGKVIFGIAMAYAAAKGIKVLP